MMTISDVPTRTPVPSAVMKRSCFCESANDNGNSPASTDLWLMSVFAVCIYYTSLEVQGTYAVAITTQSSNSIKKPSHIIAITASLRRLSGEYC